MGDLVAGTWGDGCGVRDRPRALAWAAAAGLLGPRLLIQSWHKLASSPAYRLPPTHSMSSAYVLLQFSSDPWNARFEDLENRLAFSVCVLLLSLGFPRSPVSC